MLELIQAIPAWKYTHANAVTLFRIALSAFTFLVCYPFINPYAAFFLFAFAACTDGVDGWIARSLKCESAFGKFLDPLADKILAHLTLWTIALHHSFALWCVIPLTVFSVYDPSTTLLRLKDKAMPTSRKAKWKTAVLFVALGSMLLSIAIMQSAGGYQLFPQELALPLKFSGVCMLWVATFLAAVSLTNYVRTSELPLLVDWREVVRLVWFVLLRR